VKIIVCSVSVKFEVGVVDSERAKKSRKFINRFFENTSLALIRESCRVELINWQHV